MSMRGAVAGCLVLVCLVALLAERAEGHITFFSLKEMKQMRDREGTKDLGPRSEDSQLEPVTVPELPQVEQDGNPVSSQDKTVEFTVRLSPKQLDHVAPVLEEYIEEILEEKAK
ncbi:motilin-like isoform X1 [Pleuronectes platessa]|uniref:motilin-like isoform X1 n=1 Tax=Pleuronectes platessa TaxID=8262 RepID=UPI00232A4021|nr:motilin-like isoform X1 [Pleuronectes platessa]